MAALLHRGASLRYAAIARHHHHDRKRLAGRQLASLFAAKSLADSSSPSTSSSLSTSSASSPSSSSSSPSTTLTRGPHSFTHEVNRSKFVATAFGSVRSAAEALALIKAASARDAAHNCFAFVVSPGLSERSSDDGEPAGTAGRPILGAISGEGLERVAVLVSRWRSGPKLGPGGLSRAYGAAARGCLRAAAESSGALVTFEESCVVEVVVAVDAVGGAYAALLSACGGSDGIQEEYGTGDGNGKGDVSSSSSSSSSSLASGLVRLRATVARSAVAAVSAAVAGASAGKGTVSIVAASDDDDDEDGDEEGER